MSASADTVSVSGPNQGKAKARRINRFDSPWLNPKFIIGLCMVLFVALGGLIGQLFWPMNLSYPASSPLNLPPAWVPGYGEIRTTAEVDAAVAAAGAAAPTPSSSLTGGNPFAKQNAELQAASASPDSPFGSPTWEHPMGTESNGRDMLAVLLVGAPRSLYIGLIAATIGMFIGIILGFTAGYLGGWVDAVIPPRFPSAAARGTAAAPGPRRGS